MCFAAFSHHASRSALHVVVAIILIALPGTHETAMASGKQPANVPKLSLQYRSGAAPRILSIVTVRGKQYCQWDQLRAAGTSTKESHQWSFDGMLISAVRSGFFIRVERNDTTQVLQMPLPTMFHMGAMYVPYPHFFSSLADAGYLRFDRQRNSVRINARPQIVAASLKKPATSSVPRISKKVRFDDETFDEEMVKGAPEHGVQEHGVQEQSSGKGQDAQHRAAPHRTSSEGVHDTDEETAGSHKTPKPKSVMKANDEIRHDDGSSGRDSIEAKPASKPSPGPSPKSLKPGRRMFPEDIKRRELEDSSQSMLRWHEDSSPSSASWKPVHGRNGARGIGGRHLKDDTGGDRRGWCAPRPLFASLSMVARSHPLRLTRVRVRVRGSTASIVVTSEKPLNIKPRIRLRSHTLRIEFPLAVNTSPPPRLPVGILRSYRSFVEKNAQVYEFGIRKGSYATKLVASAPRWYEIRLEPRGSKESDVERGSESESRRDEAPAERSGGAVTDAGARASLPLETVEARRKWKFDCVVIDAGHGGKDDGAHSIRGYKEKDATLGIALKLRNELRRLMPSLKIVMTRSGDVFIPLHERGAIANRAGARLFISLHCNSVPRKPSPASGCETYILSPAKTQAAIDVSVRENAVVHMEEGTDKYAGMTDDAKVLATLAQTSFVKLSSTFARHVQQRTTKSAGLQDRGISQAGFLVLVCASMPAVLIETGFVSNEVDEKVLFTERGQNKIAEGVARAVQDYALSYSRLLRP